MYRRSFSDHHKHKSSDMQEWSTSNNRDDKQNINKFNFNIWLFGYIQLNLSYIKLILQIYRSLFFIYLFILFVGWG